jgi:hypothetical protein
MGKRRNAHRILGGTTEGNKSLGTQRRKSENNIKMDLK